MNKKNNKILVLIICFIVGVLLIILGSILGVKSLIESYRQDKKKTNEMVTEIVTQYGDFESKINSYNKNLTDLVNLLNESSYYDKLIKNYDEINKLLNDITEQLKELSSYQILNDSCNKKYVDGKANRACSSYSQTYEKCVNIYVDIVKLYNSAVEKTKGYASSFELKQFDGYISDYLDYNSDGEFLGKNVTTSRGEVKENDKEEE